MTPWSNRRVVVVEDEPGLRDLVKDVLSGRGAEVLALSTLAEAEAELARQQPDLLILDVKLPDGDGLNLLERLRDDGVRVPAVVMTAFGTVDRAVQALRAGAADFMEKPFDNERLVAAVAKALQTSQQLDEVAMRAPVVADGASDRAPYRELVGADGGLGSVMEVLPRIASSNVTILINGESGTGKELIARAIHACSPRLDGPLVAVNCAAIPATLLESELFGFERGAFTGAHARRKGHIEAAEGGTLFLDEIGDMSLDAQSRLLRVLEARTITRVGGRSEVPVDVRVVAATHRDLDERVAQGLFREDLLYRLAVVPIELPPLRDRKEDIPGLVEHFLDKHGQRHGCVGPRPDADVLSRLRDHPWPGNVRELENFVQRAVVLGRFEFSALERRRSSVAPTTPAPAPTTPAPAPAPPEGAPVRTLKEVVHEAERTAVVAALKAAGGNKRKAAVMLGVSYKTLFNKIKEHGIRSQLDIS